MGSNFKLSENFESTLRNRVEKAVQDRIFDIACPHCGESVHVPAGKSVCPYCHKEIALSLNVNFE
jgi:uncharacterized OB-fold protein